jgi:hypothetical protein
MVAGRTQQARAVTRVNDCDEGGTDREGVNEVMAELLGGDQRRKKGRWKAETHIIQDLVLIAI